jgi:hypothetical protein
MLSRRNDGAILIRGKEIRPKPCQGPRSSPRPDTLGQRTVLSGKVNLQRHRLPASSNMTPYIRSSIMSHITFKMCQFVLNIYLRDYHYDFDLDMLCYGLVMVYFNLLILHIKIYV